MVVDHNQIKLLLIDIELSYALGYFFPSKKPQYISAKQIKHHQFCLCAAWQWDHEVTRHVIKLTDNKKRFKKNFRDDYIIAKILHQLMTEADVIVAHNGDSFDLKHANNLFIKHDLGPIPERKSIDTLKAARKYFNFAGNDLDSLSKRFGGSGKDRRPCWFKLTDGDPKEINIAAEYCLQDVKELQRVLVHLKPYIQNLPAFKGHHDILECECCGSKRLRNKGFDWDGKKRYRRISCLECGHHHKAKIKK